MRSRYITRQLVTFRRIRGRIIPVVMKATAFEDARVPKAVRNSFESLQKAEAWSRSLVPKIKKVPAVGKFGVRTMVANLKQERLSFWNSFKDAAANPKSGEVFSRYARMVMNANKKKR